MIESYARGEDIHIKTGIMLAGITLEDFNSLPKDEKKLIRYRAKAANFGLCYGAGWRGYQAYASQNYGLELTDDEAKEQRQNYFDMYPKLETYHKKYIALCKKDGGVKTFFGFKRQIPEIYEKENKRIKSEAENQAVNTPIQGTAGQLTLFCINLLRFRLDPSVKMVNTVHDSIHFYIPKKIKNETMKLIKLTMENAPVETYFGKKIEKVKMEVDFSVSDDSWGKLEEIEF
jgi:DNA polymerase-1